MFEKLVHLNGFSQNKVFRKKGQIPQGLELYSTTFDTQYVVFIFGRVL
jgi:hypothetical protein